MLDSKLQIVDPEPLTPDPWP